LFNLLLQLRFSACITSDTSCSLFDFYPGQLPFIDK
jgi:hypothetical protein